MAHVHFVAHHADQPLCGRADDPEWIESSRPQSVTCPACSSRLTGVRTDDEPADRRETAHRGDRDA